MARVQGHSVVLVGQDCLGAGRGCSGVEIGCVEGHSEVCRDRCEQKGIGSSILITILKIVL